MTDASLRKNWSPGSQASRVNLQRQVSGDVNLSIRQVKKGRSRPWRKLTSRFQRNDDFSATDDQTGRDVSRMNTYSEITSSLHGIPSKSSHGEETCQRSVSHDRNQLVLSVIDGEKGEVNQEFIAKFEFLTRLLLLISGSFVLGNYFPEALPTVRKITEYTGVAWITCSCIIVGTWMRKNQKENDKASISQAHYQKTGSALEKNRINEGIAFSDVIVGGLNDEQSICSKALNDADPSTRGINKTSPFSDETINDTYRSQGEMRSPVHRMSEVKTSAHPSLEPFFVVDAGTKQRVFPNLKEAFTLKTDYFEGKMMILIRTPNVDDPSQDLGTAENAAASNYLAGKQRRFEFQFQIKLKKIPTGRVYFACEIGETIRMGMIQRAFVSAAMAFVKTTNNSFHYSITGTSKSPDGKYEKPHMAFPVEEGMNRVVATPPGHEPPLLGEEIFEDMESIRARKKGVPIKWNLEDTYTLSLWSAYVDFLEWHCCNLPGIRPFGMSNLFGRQPLYLTLYEIPFDKESEKHNRCDIINIVELEMCHTDFSDTGKLAQQWIDSNRVNSDDKERSMYLKRTEDDYGGLDEEYLGEEEDDENAAAELGEGIYIRSGEIVTLRETMDYDSVGYSSSYVASGGGFAVLQEQNSCSIVIQKAGGQHSRRGKSEKSGLIKEGETVLIKMVGEGNETKFLSLHKGWWLKWIASAPTKNGFFTIHSNERGKTGALSSAAQSPYLNLDGSFYLRHKRWSKYLVGVSREGSATYGGRMLGLRNPKEGLNRALRYNGEDDDLLLDADLQESEEKCESHWMYPLYLEICDAPHAIPSLYDRKNSLDYGMDANEGKQITFSSAGNQMDVPAWVEVMNRVERIIQLAYVVRVTPPPEKSTAINIDGYISDNNRTNDGGALLRLRTGRDLSQVIRAGIHWRNSNNKSKERRRSISEAGNLPAPSSTHSGAARTGDEAFENFILDTANRVDKTQAESASNRNEELLPNEIMASSDNKINSEVEVVATSPLDGAVTQILTLYDLNGSLDQSDRDSDLTDESESVGDPELQEGFDDAESLSDDAHRTRASKGRKFIGKIAKSVKSRTASTGKKVVRQSMKVGKGTVNAGKAMISGRSRHIPPQKEPRSAKPRTRRRAEKDLHVPVNKRAMKRAGKVESRYSEHPASFVAALLSAPEQSRRTVSNMLKQMSSVPADSVEASKFSSLLSSQIQIKSQLDKSFLQGGSVELGVTPNVKKSVVFECLVARCLWESHWREEWCGLYEKSIVFYAPLSQESSLEVSFKDIQSVRLLDPGVMSPLPGYPMLVIETAWLCHYVVLNNDDTRALLKARIEDSLSALEVQSTGMSETETELWKARLWQGLQHSSLSPARGKWADVHCNQKWRRRVVLNQRRMAFDLPPHELEIHTFIEGLLATSLSFEFDSLQHHPEALTAFLDSTSVLKGLRLQDMQRLDTKTFCTFVNLYHCLFQHALLVTANGPLTRRSHECFMRTTCYEIGGDIFSLSELSNCIIRGNMSKPNPPKAPYVDAPKKSNSYRYFSLPFLSPNVNFLLNTGDTSCSANVAVIQADYLDTQLAICTADFLRRNVSVDISKRVITIPKVCEVYRNDFPSDPSMSSSMSCLRYCLRFLDEDLAGSIYTLLQDEATVTIKYRDSSDQYHSRLKRQFGDFVEYFPALSD